ncbi:MAG: outer membrane beta-barrel protein, partial [Edaphobacter sp.]
MAQSKRKTALTQAISAALSCCIGIILTGRPAQAQDASPPTPPSSYAPAAAPEAAPASIWSVGGIDFSGLVDGYYNLNANHPPDSSNGNQLRNFDYNANAFSLNMAKLTMSHDPDPVGLRIDLGFGKAFNEILSSEPDFKHLEQAYVSWKPARGKGFEADFGEFVTSAGAEVIETKDNWNYSRSLLFSLAIPYYHVGLRTSMPITKSFTGGVQVVNGWNNFSDNNSGKTIGLTGVYT